MKRAKIAFYHLFRAVGLFALARRLTRRHVRILCYHGVWRGDPGFAGDSMFISPETFEARLKLLRKRNYPVLSLDAAVDALGRGVALPSATVVITIDDGWYSTFADMLPALRRHGMTATLYCDTGNLLAGPPIAHVMARYLRRIHLGETELPPAAADAYSRATDLSASHETRYAAALEFALAVGIDIAPVIENRVFGYMTADELAEAAAEGLAIQLHTHTHDLGDFSGDRIAGEVRQNREALGAILGRDPLSFRHFCYPSGQTHPGAAAALAAEGIASATTLEQRLARPDDDLLMLPRLLDGEHLTEVEFEAEISGAADHIRRLRAFASGLVRRPLKPQPGIAAGTPIRPAR